LKRRITVNIGNFLLSLSEALDLVDPLLTQHQQRTAFIVWEMGKIASMSQERLSEAFIAALLHDIGAFSIEEKLAIKNFETENTQLHCLRGEILLKQLPWLYEIGLIVRHHHTGWDQWNESIENPVVFASQMLFLADYVERKIDRKKYILHQHERIKSEIRRLAGSLLHPHIVELFMITSEREEFWLDLVNHRLYSLLLNEGPFKGKEIDFDEITLISEFFRNIIDFRSPFTATHSAGVAAAASILSKMLGFTEMEIKLMAVAGNLHDIGKLAVPNQILNKRDKLSKKEVALMKAHPYYTFMVINTIGGLQQIAEWAAYHHEKLDGSGYPFRCNADELTLGSRIMMVADIFTALTENRPYRKGMSLRETLKLLKNYASKEMLDKKVVNMLIENSEIIYQYITQHQEKVREVYETQFSIITETTPV